MYIDESGDLGEAGSKYIIISALIVRDFHPLDRIIKNMRRHKFKKELKKAKEIKANKSSKAVRYHMMKKLNEVEFKTIKCIVLDKEKMYGRFTVDDKHKLYDYITGKLAEYLKLPRAHVVVRIDKSKGKQILRDNFDRYFSRKLKNFSFVNRVDCHHSYSHSWSGLQFTDMIAWACFQKYEHNDISFIDLIEDIEIFEIWKYETSGSEK